MQVKLVQKQDSVEIDSQVQVQQLAMAQEELEQRKPTMEHI